MKLNGYISSALKKVVCFYLILLGTLQGQAYAKNEASSFNYDFATVINSEVFAGSSYGAFEKALEKNLMGYRENIYFSSDKRADAWNTAACAALSMPPATNDPCSGALPVTCGNTYTGTTVGSTTEAIPAACGNTTSPSVWYSIVGTGGTITASLCGSAYDTQISIFSGTCAALTCIGTNDDFCGTQSQISWAAAAGVTYYIRVMGYLNNAGNYTLAITCPPAVTNDPCSGAIATACGGTYTGTTVGATTEAIPAACGNATSNSVWYSFVGNGNNITASLCGSAFDTQISVFTGSCAALACVGTNDDFCGLQSQISWSSAIGVTYYIRVMGYGAASGTFSLAITCASAVANDGCGGAIPVSCGNTIVGTTVGAGPDVVPAACGSSASPGVWYSLLGDGSTFILNLCGSAYDTQISVYTGTCTALNCYAYNDDNFLLCGVQSYVTFPTVNGVIYYIQVHGWGTSSGAFNMAISCYTESGNDPCAGALPVACGQTINGTTTGLNPDLIPAGCGVSNAAGAWYSIVGNGQLITASLCGATYDTQISVFSGSCTTLTCVNTNDDFCGAQSETSWLSINGATYYILVHGYLDAGIFSLALSCQVYLPGPQECSGAVNICADTQFGGNSSGSGILEDLNATNQGCLASGENQSSWYVFQPTTTGTISFAINPTPIVDYDFAIWGPMSAPACPPSVAPLRCSFSALQAATGLGNGAVDLTEGAAGNAWVAPITVTPADLNKYYIMCLDNFSSTTTPFVFDWSLSGVILNCGILLPVELNSFDGQALPLHNVLNWSTASEMNNAKFEILSSSDGMHFEKIGELNGHGTCAVAQHYSFIDHAPKALVTYYQLNQVDFNGASDRSDIIVVTREASVNVAPNPVEDILNLTVVSSKEQQMTLELLDMTGRVVMSEKFMASTSHALVQWDVNDLPAGVYTFVAYTASGNLVVNQKIMRK